MHSVTREEILDDLGIVLLDLQDAFEESVAKKDETINSKYDRVKDGYFTSHLIRAGVKQYLYECGYDLAYVANTGIEIAYDGKYRIKVVRSSHASEVPAPRTVNRAAWCMSNQPRLFVDNLTPEDVWSIKKLGLHGGGNDAAVVGALVSQNDEYVHLLVDWEEIPSQSTVRMAVSLPVGAWAPGEEPKVAWRTIVTQDLAGNSEFTPSDEYLNIFLDDEDNDEGLGVAVG